MDRKFRHVLPTGGLGLCGSPNIPLASFEWADWKGLTKDWRQGSRGGTYTRKAGLRHVCIELSHFEE